MVVTEPMVVIARDREKVDPPTRRRLRKRADITTPVAARWRAEGKRDSSSPFRRLGRVPRSTFPFSNTRMIPSMSMERGSKKTRTFPVRGFTV
jgi:hypothetical protein